MPHDKNPSLAWGIITAGKIARKFCSGVLRSRTGSVAAVAARDLDRAEAFAGEFGIPQYFASYQALIEEPSVQAVYIGTPHPMHAEWAIAAANAGKHVLCEKPIGMNSAEAGRIVDAAREAGVFLMEAFMYRCHPQTARLVELVREGRVGELRAVRATFSYKGTYDLKSLKLDKKLGGGGILDVGCYPVSMTRLLVGAAHGSDFEQPVAIEAMACLGGESMVDEYATAILRFDGGVLAQLACGVQLAMDNTVTVFGSEGRLEVLSPWFCSGIEGGSASILVKNTLGELEEEIVTSTADWLYAIEADTVARNLDRRQAPPPAMTWDDTLGNMEVLDRWLESAGMSYD
ncbi:MAG: Gfo/Idh/MocA family oxidoreductase [Candidatus Glassbacteria bacterium]|nr:Gfo/Idh/MocA family oxidoreductase [Candidatus Glassbacteria bacterium]